MRILRNMAVVASGMAVVALGVGPAVSAAPAAAQQSAVSIGTVAYPWDIPHRGAGAAPYGLNPEGTMAAYKYSVNTLGQPFVDVDLWLTTDNALVIHHDDSLADTSCPNRNVSTSTAAQINSCTYNDGGSHVLFYSDVLDQFGDTVLYTPEPKQPSSGALVSKLRQVTIDRGLQQNTLIQETVWSKIDNIVADGTGVIRGSVNCKDPSPSVTDLKAHDVKYVSVSYGCDDQTFYHYQANGIDVIAWTIDLHSVYQRLRNLPAPPIGYFSNDLGMVTGSWPAE